MNRKPLTDEQIIEAVETARTQKEAAEALGIHRRTLERRLEKLRLRGYDPKHDMVHVAAEGFSVAGTSTLYDAEGNIKQQWVKTRQDSDAVQKLIEAMLEGINDEIRRAKPVRAPKLTNDDLLNCFVVTDYHLGMLSWGEETGADWDLQIAEDTLVAWFAEAIRQAPKAETAILAQLGDFLHWDGMDAVTPTSKHLLDADTRFNKLVRSAIKVVRRVIAMLLERHEHVHVLMAEGNHDLASSVWLRELLAVVYEDEPRVTVETSPDPYYCYEHGNTSLFFHHGHLSKHAKVDAVFAAKFRDVFGRTQHSYAHMGHLHHIDVKETNLMVIEQHRTLAAPDAYASRGGWMSGRDAKVITYSKTYGEAGRVTVPFERVVH